MSAPAHDDAAAPGWWRRNRHWLPTATVLGVLAFYLPWRINERELDRIRPRTAVTAPADAAAWREYEGARWRITGVRREPARAGTAAEYLHADATRLLVEFEVLAGAQVDAARLDQCKGRLVDADGRAWEANFPAKLSTWMLRQGLDGRCGTRVRGTPAAAVAGQPFAFTHAYLIPSDVPVEGMQVDLFFPPSTTTPTMGRYLRFPLPAPRD
ncbi:conserved hypothetical protein [Luteimonas sp. 9C]|uniref:hypothetical protein n=1 Tax=Luteimonas sp. 9C TaxID=2653148 RepID=UPI0012F448BB|nr:hypothetical protein [Luteimonas sp. 9C]VXB59069.1 conserved hypothetical protein [Luteimonas sp. 9C]